jgi:hypothetical protein
MNVQAGVQERGFPHSLFQLTFQPSTVQDLLIAHVCTQIE